MEIIFAIIAIVMLVALFLILRTQNRILDALKKIRIPEPQKIEFPKMEFPKIELPKIELPKIEVPPVEIPPLQIPPAKEYSLDLNPVVEAINKSVLEIKKLHEAEQPAKAEDKAAKEAGCETNDLVKILQETATLMRVNEAEFQSGLEAFHKAIDKLLTQVPNGEKELNAQKEFMQKFEDAMRRTQETAAEAMNENSLRLQEILAEVLAKGAK